MPNWLNRRLIGQDDPSAQLEFGSVTNSAARAAPGRASAKGGRSSRERRSSGHPFGPQQAAPGFPDVAVERYCAKPAIFPTTSAWTFELLSIVM
jgi:hypothetical protein